MDARKRARQVENATNQCDILPLRQDNDAFTEARECQSCRQTLAQISGGPLCDWNAFPAGVKFDPSDEELLQHLKAANGVGAAKSHPLIKNFISELDGEDGICQMHPEKLPGVKKDGSSKHFFHRPAKAYTTGTRKRRKINDEEEAGVETRWHKTGKTRSVSEGGRVLGWKKIMVLYKNTGTKKSKSEKTNWILHQYHLGQSEEERDGELVVCKVFYQKQPRQCTGGRTAEGGAASEMENVDLNQGSNLCVSELSRGGVPETPKVDEQQRLRPTRDTPGNRGAAAVTQSSKGSELTVMGMDTQAASASELTSTPLSSKNEAIFSSLRAGNYGGSEKATSSMMNNGRQDATGSYPVLSYEEVTDTSDKPCQAGNDSSLCRVNERGQDDCHQFLPSFEHESQQPFLEDQDILSLFCNEEMGPQFFNGFSCELDDIEEPYVSNPNEDYPHVDDIQNIDPLGSPPAIIPEFMFSSQEAADVLYTRSSFLDNDDSLSSTQ